MTAERLLPQEFWERKIERLHQELDERLSAKDSEISTLRSQVEALREALANAFPHFEDGKNITPERIAEVGKEYVEMVMGWEPSKDLIEFSDQDGNTRAIIYDAGDWEAGIGATWTIPEDADWEVAALNQQPKAES